MTLFSTRDIKTYSAAAPSVRGTEQVQDATTVLAHLKESVDQIFPDIRMGTNYHYATMGEWSSAELLYHLLRITGPAAVYFTTWSIKESPVRKLMEMQETGLITELHALMDFRVRSTTPAVYFLAKNNSTRIGLSSIHAKTTVIKNDRWAVSVISSANYTNNHRIERGVICCDPAVAAFDMDWISKELDQAKPFV